MVPVNLGQEIETIIESYGHEGEGVARFQDFALFIPGALKGETVKAKVAEVKKNYARAKVLQVLNTVPERVKPSCPIYALCGGCQLQHLDYRAQLELKRQRVIDAVERIGGLKDVTVHTTIGMKDPWRYRNKVQYPVGLYKDRLALGFYRQGTHCLVPVSDCLIQPLITNKVAAKVRELAIEYRLPVYNEKTGKGVLRHVLIKTAYLTGEVMVVLVINGDYFPAGPRFARDLAAVFPQIKSIVQNINRSRGNVILGDTNQVLWGSDGIVEKVGGLSFKFSAGSFFQVNPVQTQTLYGKAMDYADLSWRELVLDAYAGVGSLTLFLAKKAKQVYGIEVSPQAVANAKENAVLNGIDNVRFITGAVERELPKLVAGQLVFDVAVLDPPRSGCEERVLKSLAQNMIKRIVYVSCNPSTMARDLKILDELGYRTEEIQPVDMFPHTYHVECVARVERR
ncbi:MAG: 23S rRNA (uracil(1939)-C(5))-methyltransferase RlmD [Firmicutes bacterium]|nr:23S rRNA (uracil(1939)-C(5))-methyltransferase RlmD [Bacillota bacterium]